MFLVKVRKESRDAVRQGDSRRRRREFAAALGLLIFSLTPFVAGQSAAPANNPFAGEAVVIDQYDTGGQRLNRHVYV